MAGRRFKVGDSFVVQLNNDEFVELRKQPALEAIFVAMGEQWVGRLNAELHAAQKARGQPIADGYNFRITRGGSRIRMYIRAFTARAAAHEKKHSSILKLMQTTGHDVEVHATNLPSPREIAEGGG